MTKQICLTYQIIYRINIPVEKDQLYFVYFIVISIEKMTVLKLNIFQYGRALYV